MCRRVTQCTSWVDKPKLWQGYHPLGDIIVQTFFYFLHSILCSSWWVGTGVQMQRQLSHILYHSFPNPLESKMPPNGASSVRNSAHSSRHCRRGARATKIPSPEIMEILNLIVSTLSHKSIFKQEKDKTRKKAEMLQDSFALTQVWPCTSPCGPFIRCYQYTRAQLLQNPPIKW